MFTNRKKVAMLENIIEAYPEEEFLKADGFDEAIIGLDEKSMRLIYSIKGIIHILENRDKMSEQEASEYFDFNIAGAYVGEKTPIFCEDRL